MLMEFYNNDLEQNIESLVNYAIELNELNYDLAGEPLVCILAKDNHFSMLKQIHTLGANLDEKSKNKYTKGSTALIEASYHGHLDIVKYLVEHGVDLNHYNYMGNTALMMAVQNKKTDVVEYLVSKGVNVEIADKNNVTPLMIACGKGYYEIAKCLIEQGADVSRIDDDGDSALTLASKKRAYDIIKLLK
jgi:ankyrin repeat protein